MIASKAHGASSTAEPTAFERAFFFRYQRFPRTEYEYKILPMIFFQQQLKAKQAVRIQAWFRGVKQRIEMARRVRFDIPWSPEFTEVAETTNPNDTTIGALANERDCLKKEMKEFVWCFQRDHGHAPNQEDLRPIRHLQKRYVVIKKALSRLERGQHLYESRATWSKEARCSTTPDTACLQSKSIEDISSGDEERQEPASPAAFHFMDAVVQSSNEVRESPLIGDDLTYANASFSAKAPRCRLEEYCN